MTDEVKRTGGEPVFDTDRAWDRFERIAAREPAPAFWMQAHERMHPEQEWINERSDGTLNIRVKENTVEMKQTDTTTGTQESRTASAARENGAKSAWRTERPARRRLRRLTAGAAAAAIAIGLFTTPLGDRAMAALMQTFRIQHVVGVGMTADDMTTISGLLESGSPEGDRSFNLAQYGTLTQTGGGESATLTWSEAEQRMGVPLHPLQNSTAPVYQPAATLTFKLNVQAVNRLLTRLGSTTTLPAEADGKAIRLDIPDGISTEGTLSGKPVRLLQFGKPKLNVEDGIDAEKVREAVLGLPVLPDSLRTKLAAIGDWRSTLPVPARDGVTTNLRLGGYDAVMTMDSNHRYLLWLEGDRIVLLSGDTKDFPTESDFQRAAEELIQP